MDPNLTFRITSMQDEMNAVRRFAYSRKDVIIRDRGVKNYITPLFDAARFMAHFRPSFHAALFDEGWRTTVSLLMRNFELAPSSKEIQETADAILSVLTPELRYDFRAHFLARFVVLVSPLMGVPPTRQEWDYDKSALVVTMVELYGALGYNILER